MFGFRAHSWWAFLFLFLPVTAFAIEADSAAARKFTDSIKVHQASQVVVTGTRNEVRLKDSPVRVEVIGKERIATTGMSDVGDLLKEQTGLLITGAFRNGIQMNGLGPDYTLILIDGQPIIGRVAGVIDLSRLSVGNIERVEVVKGPMSSMYGSEALAGVINIITKRPKDNLHGSAMVQGVTTGPLEARVETGWGSDDLELTGFVNLKHQIPFSLPLDTAMIPYAGFTDATAQMKLQWNASRSWTIRSWLRGFGSETSGEFAESFGGQVARNRGSVVQWDASATAGAEYRSGRARLSMNAYGSTYHERYNFDTIQGNAGSIDDLIRRIGRLYAQYDLQLGAANRLTTGGEVLLDDISGSRYTDSAGNSPFYRTLVGFMQWEGLPNEWLSYVVSARVDANSVYGTAVSPRLSLLYKPGDHLRVSGSIGTGFKAPDFRQLYVSFSNLLTGAGYALLGAERLGNSLSPERSVSYDVGIRYEEGQRTVFGDASLLYSAEIRAFRNNLQNLIETYEAGRQADLLIYSYRNISRAYTQGIEANAQVALAFDETGVFTVSGGYQFLDANDAEVLDAINDGTAGTIDQPLTLENYGGLWGRSKNSGTLRVQFDDSERRWSANVRFQFVGRAGNESLDKNGFVMSDPPRRVLDRPDEYVEAYTVFNIGVTRAFTLHQVRYMIGAGANNIFDRYHPILIPGLVGRQFYLQLSATF